MLLSQLGMTLQHTSLAVKDEWIAESRNLYLVPGFAKDNVAFEDLIFESSSETSFRCSLLDDLFNLTSHSADGTYLSSLELSDFKLAIEHPLNKCCILVNLERFSN